MVPAAHLVLRLWAAEPGDDWYRYVRLEYGLVQARAKRPVRWALGVYGLSPATSREYADLRPKIRRGDVWWEAIQQRPRAMTLDPARRIAADLFAAAFLISVGGPWVYPRTAPRPHKPSSTQTTVIRPVAPPATQSAAIVAVVATPEATPEPTSEPTPEPTPLPTVEPTCVPTPVPAVVYTPPPAPSYGGSHEDWMAAAGIPASEWASVAFIMLKESGGNPNAVNASSGSCGLFPQLPCGKWAHQWNDPVGAMIDATVYARERYDEWNQAAAAWRAKGWW